MPPNVEAFVDLAVIQAGDRYRFGAEVSADDPDPDEWDCSELIEWLGARLRITPKIPDGSWIQYRHCHNHGTTITPAVAIATRGALLFRFSSDPLKGGRPSSSHVAISLGDNRTVEARSTSAASGCSATPAPGCGLTPRWCPGSTTHGPARRPPLGRPRRGPRRWPPGYSRIAGPVTP